MTHLIPPLLHFLALHLCMTHQPSTGSAGILIPCPSYLRCFFLFFFTPSLADPSLSHSGSSARQLFLSSPRQVKKNSVLIHCVRAPSLILGIFNFCHRPVVPPSRYEGQHRHCQVRDTKAQEITPNIERSHPKQSGASKATSHSSSPCKPPSKSGLHTENIPSITPTSPSDFQQDPLAFSRSLKNLRVKSPCFFFCRVCQPSYSSNVSWNVSSSSIGQ